MSGYSYILRSTVRRDQIPKVVAKKAATPPADVLTVEAPVPPVAISTPTEPARVEVVAPKPRRRRKKSDG